jgi:hypothetical protein
VWRIPFVARVAEPYLLRKLWCHALRLQELEKYAEKNYR